MAVVENIAEDFFMNILGKIGSAIEDPTNAVKRAHGRMATLDLSHRLGKFHQRYKSVNTSFLPNYTSFAHSPEYNLIYELRKALNTNGFANPKMKIGDQLVDRDYHFSRIRPETRQRLSAIAKQLPKLMTPSRNLDDALRIRLAQAPILHYSTMKRLLNMPETQVAELRRYAADTLWGYKQHGELPDSEFYPAIAALNMRSVFRDIPRTTTSKKFPPYNYFYDYPDLHGQPVKINGQFNSGQVTGPFNKKPPSGLYIETRKFKPPFTNPNDPFKERNIQELLSREQFDAEFDRIMKKEKNMAQFRRARRIGTASSLVGIAAGAVSAGIGIPILQNYFERQVSKNRHNDLGSDGTLHDISQPPVT